MPSVLAFAILERASACSKEGRRSLAVEPMKEVKSAVAWSSKKLGPLAEIKCCICSCNYGAGEMRFGKMWVDTRSQQMGMKARRISPVESDGTNE